MNCAHPRSGAPADGDNFAEASPLVPKFAALRGSLEATLVQRKGPSVAGPRTTGRSSLQGGFTLIEMIMVLVIIAIMAGLSMPAMQSAFTEQAVRKDTHQLALMVKTAMIQSAEQHRNYVIDLTENTMALHPEGEAAADPVSGDATDPTSAPDNNADADGSNNLAPIDVTVTTHLDPPNQLMIPDPVKADAWIAIPDGTEWVFQPGELCPATTVRLKRGEAYLEMSFSALTGDVENEKSSIP